MDKYVRKKGMKMRFASLHRDLSGYEDSKTVILPVAFEGTVTYLKGTAKGPSAILKASGDLELLDDEVHVNAAEKGIHTARTIRGKGAKSVAASVEKKVARVIDDKKLPIVVGGEHSITFGAVKAAAARYANLSVLQLDAHTDLYPEFEGDAHSHASVMSRVCDLYLPVVQAGIRSISEETLEEIKKKGITTFFAHEMRSDPDWMRKALEKLTENVYVTIDLDAFDPSVMPGVGTPEPGGMGWYEVTDLLRMVAKNRNVVGFDIVELRPTRTDHITPFSAAKLLYKFLCYLEE